MRRVGNRASRTSALAVAATIASTLVPAAWSAAATYTYDFSNLPAGTVPTAGQTPPPAGVSWQGIWTQGGTATTPGGIGQIGPDNWVWNSSQANQYSAIVRGDARPGFSGAYVSAYTTAATAAVAAPTPYDSINSRVNNAAFNYAIPAGQTFSVGFTGAVQGLLYNNANTATTGVRSSVTSRVEMALGYDQNGDGDIRGDSANTENAEWGPLFGFEPSAAANETGGLVGKFYVRPAALGTAVQVNANGPGVYRFELRIDPTANPVGAAFDGSGALYVQMLFDADGNAVSDTLHVVAGLESVNLGLTRMTSTTAGGTAGGWDPSNWNGFLTRVASNGAIDNVTITTIPEPAALAALAGLTLVARRRRR